MPVQRVTGDDSLREGAHRLRAPEAADLGADTVMMEGPDTVNMEAGDTVFIDAGDTVAIDDSRFDDPAFKKDVAAKLAWLGIGSAIAGAAAVLEGEAPASTLEVRLRSLRVTLMATLAAGARLSLA